MKVYCHSVYQWVNIIDICIWMCKLLVLQMELYHTAWYEHH